MSVTESRVDCQVGRCPACLGGGSISGGAGVEYQCARCLGSGLVAIDVTAELAALRRLREQVAPLVDALRWFCEMGNYLRQVREFDADGTPRFHTPVLTEGWERAFRALESVNAVWTREGGG